MGQQGFWDFEARHQKLQAKKDFLVYLDEVVPWESFRAILEQIYDTPRKSAAGRRPTDVVLMFKLLVLQQMYNIDSTRKLSCTHCSSRAKARARPDKLPRTPFSITCVCTALFSWNRRRLFHSS